MMELNEIVEKLKEAEEREIRQDTSVALKEAIEIVSHFKQFADKYSEIVSQKTEELKEKCKPGSSIEECDPDFSAKLSAEIDKFCAEEARSWLCKYFTKRLLEHKEDIDHE